MAIGQMPLPHLCLSALHIIYPASLDVILRRKGQEKDFTDSAKTMNLLRKITKVTKLTYKLQDCISYIR